MDRNLVIYLVKTEYSSPNNAVMPSIEPIQIQPLPILNGKENGLSSLKSPTKNGDVFVNTFGIPLPPPAKKPLEILDIDKETPDGHVPRDPIQVRLTGVHPLNSESPLTALFDEGTVLRICGAAGSIRS